MDWKEIQEGTKALAGIAAQKINEASDLASLHLKLKTAEYRLRVLYEELGKLTFAQVRGEAAEGAEARVAELVEMIEGKLAEQQAIREELDRRKAEKEAKRAEEKTEFEATAEAPAEEAADEAVELPVDTDATAE